jgi:hypothetical protein
MDLISESLNHYGLSPDQKRVSLNQEPETLNLVV